MTRRRVGNRFDAPKHRKDASQVQYVARQNRLSLGWGKCLSTLSIASIKLSSALYGTDSCS